MRFEVKSFLYFLLPLAGICAPALASDSGDKDNYRFRVEGDWWFIHPRGDFGARSSNNYINSMKISISATIQLLPANSIGDLNENITFF